MGNRMALGITTILTIMFLLGSLNGSMPKVSYPKALDWYLLVSFSLAFLSLVECMIVFVVWLNESKRKQMKVGECTLKQRRVNNRGMSLLSLLYISDLYAGFPTVY